MIGADSFDSTLTRHRSICHKRPWTRLRCTSKISMAPRARGALGSRCACARMGLRSRSPRFHNCDATRRAIRDVDMLALPMSAREVRRKEPVRVECDSSGLRQFRQHPTFAIVTVLVLGLGTGAATTVFTIRCRRASSAAMRGPTVW